MSKNQTKSTDIMVAQPVSSMTPELMKKLLKQETEKRKILTSFIKDHLKEGVDYGTIRIESKRTGKVYETKPTLFKPGAEKFCSMFRIQAEYYFDEDTWKMLGEKVGTIAYKCVLYGGGSVVGEGRGVCTVEEKGSENTAVKIAKKRAKLDAVLETGGLSDFFTQDLDDEDVVSSIQNREINKKAKKDELIDEAKKIIENAKTVQNIVTVIDAVKKSDKFTKAQKESLQKVAESKLEKLDA